MTKPYEAMNITQPQTLTSMQPMHPTALSRYMAGYRSAEKSVAHVQIRAHEERDLLTYVREEAEQCLGLFRIGQTSDYERTEAFLPPRFDGWYWLGRACYLALWLQAVRYSRTTRNATPISPERGA